MFAALRLTVRPLLFLGLLALTPAAHAQWAVVDVGAIAQLVQEVQMMEQELTTAQSEYQAITGDRGMEQLLSGTVRNYLPTGWNELQSVLAPQAASYGALAGDLRSALAANAVLSAQQLASLPADEAAQLQAERNTTALLQAVVGQALSAASNRFASLQSLIGAIPRATDEKAALDLQARIAAEQGMVQNEQIKLEVLYRGLQSLDWADRQRAREQVVLGHGMFGGRFRPSP